MEEHITFSGQEATPLNEEQLLNAIDLLSHDADANLVQIHHVLENCTEQQFKAMFSEGDAVSLASLYGWPVYKRSWVPLGEMWMMDKEGRVIKKFRFTPNTCPTCNGSREVLISPANADDGNIHDEQTGPCPDCKGTGKKVANTHQDADE